MSTVSRPPGSTKSRSPEALAERKAMYLAAVRQCGVPAIAAYRVGISPSNITYWKQHDEQFAEDLEAAKLHFQGFIAEKALFNIIELADGETYLDEFGKEQKARRHFQANNTLLKYAAPAEFGDRIEHTHKGNILITAIPRAQRLDELAEGEPDEDAIEASYETLGYDADDDR